MSLFRIFVIVEEVDVVTFINVDRNEDVVVCVIISFDIAVVVKAVAICVIGLEVKFLSSGILSLLPGIILHDFNRVGPSSFSKRYAAKAPPVRPTLYDNVIIFPER